ncbi:MAG: radical SAM protein [Nanoarchaeota archaeon]
MVNKKKVLLVEPSDREFYKDAKVKDVVPNSVSLTLATIGSTLLEAGHEVKILDLNHALSPAKTFVDTITSFKPDILGISFTTPLFYMALEMVKMAKEKNPNLVAIGGGAHASGYPERTLEESPFDIVCVGEGDFTIQEIANDMPLDNINGIAYRNAEGKIIKTGPKPFIDDLDTLPMPAWHLFDVEKYVIPKFTARHSPVGWMETSRGCPWGCTYCTKSVHGKNFRVKSVKRVVDEIEHMQRHGFKEFQIADDSFTTLMERSEEICDEIIRRDIKMPWVALTGIRVDRVRPELLKKMRKAGCYRMFFGIESGNQEVLKRIKKNITLDQVREAVKMTKDAGIEPWGSFMVGLPEETEQTMEDTIQFAKSLELDRVKCTITIPLPATPLHKEYMSRGLIPEENWTEYNLYKPARELYTHPTLDWDTIERYHNRFYKEFYFRPKYIAYRFFKDVKDGMLWTHLKVLAKIRWNSSTAGH